MKKEETVPERKQPESREVSRNMEPNRELRPQQEKAMDPPTKPYHVSKYNRER